jgi:hypothetical protein
VDQLVGLADGEEAAYALNPTRCANVATRALCATQRRTGQVHRLVALKIIADPGRGGMNPQVLSSPDLTEIDIHFTCSDRSESTDMRVSISLKLIFCLD